MAVYNVHAGHCPAGQGAYGAVGFLNESVENRIVKNQLIAALRRSGNVVYDCTDDSNTTERQNLANIVAKCNARRVDADISIHLNAGGGTGCEVWITGYHQSMVNLGNRICANISSALGIANRGVKRSRNLYVLNQTISPAILVECCFVDSRNDANRWDPMKCANAIAGAVNGFIVADGSPGSGGNAGNNPGSTTGSGILRVDGWWGRETTTRLQQIYKTPADGIVSNQWAVYRSQNPGLDSGWDWRTRPNGAGSMLIKGMQRWAGVSNVDGEIGPVTIRAIQAKLGTPVDGIVSGPSMMVRELQRWANR